MNLNNITNSELFATVVAFLSANLMTIIVLVINLIKSKVSNVNLTEKIDKVMAEHDIQLGESLLAKISDLEKQLNERVGTMCNKVEDKLHLDSEEKKAQVEENTAKINELIKSTQALLTDEGADA